MKPHCELHSGACTTYPSNLSDTEWDYLQRVLPPRSARSKLRRHSLRSIVDALFYLVRTGCPWRYLPAYFPPSQTVYYRFHRWKHECFWAQIRSILLS